MAAMQRTMIQWTLGTMVSLVAVVLAMGFRAAPMGPVGRTRSAHGVGHAGRVIVVVEGPSAAGKTTWCRTHVSTWMPEPEPGPLEAVLDAQRARWRAAVDADATGEVVVLDGDPLKLWYSSPARPGRDHRRVLGVGRRRGPA